MIRPFPGILLVVSSIFYMTCAQQISPNRPPQFVTNGDMTRFSIPEDTEVGSPVYKLIASDPEGSKLYYSISGEHFTVDKDSGVVSTLKPFDREKQSKVTVVISVTDEGIGETEPNTVSLRREITITDINDNSPVFHKRPYSFEVNENADVGKILFREIMVEDLDDGVNGDVILTCLPTGDDCDTFNILTEKINDGLYRGIVTLFKPLDYERRTSYSLTLKATDRAKDPNKRLTSTANIAINVLDLQDQPPMFVNAPYSATIPENTEEGVSILQIKARDGDFGDPRTVRVELQDDVLGYFKLLPVSSSNSTANFPVAVYDLYTSGVEIDREHKTVLQNGGIYPISVKAVELINNELPADASETTITIIITDIDDQIPTFNNDNFTISVTEDISRDSPLPGLNMIITDKDVGENAMCYLSLSDVKNSEGIFSVHPTNASGHTAVVIRVQNTTKLDYDVEDEEMRVIIFKVVASIKNEYGVLRKVAHATVTVNLQDANDNYPIFENQSYFLSIPENFKSNTLIQEIKATDKDSGANSEISYTLKGFGAYKFTTNAKTGGIYTSTSPLDYETQKSYSLNLIAKDGGNKTTSTNIYLNIEDINDNKPVFETKEYSRIIREKATSFQPEFFVHALDNDTSLAQGNGRIKYSIQSKNFKSDVITINETTGEVLVNKPVVSNDTPKGQYEMVVRATDYGTPPLYEDTRVNIRVGIPGNQRPIFKGNSKDANGVPIYKISVKENTEPNTEVLVVESFDPDGADSQITYLLSSGGKDNFVIEKETGAIKTSPYSNLDRDVNGDSYKIQVLAVDTGYPVAETGTISVLVDIEDVNNKPPFFKDNVYTKYISENLPINSTILTVSASDTDMNANLEYSIVEPIQTYDGSGLIATNNRNLKLNLFRINPQTGDIILNDIVNHQEVSVVILKVQVEDKNAVDSQMVQKAEVEVTIYTQSFREKNPIFNHPNWTVFNPIIQINMEEEIEEGSVIFTLKVKENQNNQTKVKFEMVENDHVGLFSVKENGNIIVSKKLDYETITYPFFSFKVRAVVVEDLFHVISAQKPGETVLDLQNLPQIRFSESIVNIELININDNPPIFVEKSYSKRILENVKYPYIILETKAKDLDDINGSYPVSYTLSSGNSNYFQINSTTGEITVAQNVTLDREKQSLYTFMVTAIDKPLNGGTKVFKTKVKVMIQVLDLNDNPPKFLKPVYSAVIPENVKVTTNILRVEATDPDLGLSGDIYYSMYEENEAQGFFKINAETGEVFTNRILTGKGRSEPYTVIVKASDRGDRVLDSNGVQSQKSLSSEVTLSIYVGDVINNDGVPFFIRPSIDQVAKVAEDVSLNTPIFQVIATDPDSPNSREGDIRYMFLDDGKFEEELPFQINAETGLITTKLPLDREKKDSYDLIIVAHDRGDVPQQSTRVLRVEILDVDDHTPYFKRTIYEQPFIMKVVEEIPFGSEVGFIQAIDEDIGSNAVIDYIISYGNDDGIFNISRTPDNIGVIRVVKRLDREQRGTYLLTVKCYRKRADGKRLDYTMPFNKLDPSETQVLVKVEDIDDNNPKFKKQNLTLGVRVNARPDTKLTTVEASDPDVNAPPIKYVIRYVTFGRPISNCVKTFPSKRMFYLNPKTGELSTARNLWRYQGGYFEIHICASNSDNIENHVEMVVKAYVLSDRALLKFVFDKSPREVKKFLPDLEISVSEALKLPISVNVYDTQYESKPDGSLDFSATSSCFHVIGKEEYNLKDMESLLNNPTNVELNRVYSKYGVRYVERCTHPVQGNLSWSELAILLIATVILVSSFLSIIIICFSHNSFTAKMKRRLRRNAAAAAAARPPPEYLMLQPRDGSQYLGSQLLVNQAASQIGSQTLTNQESVKESYPSSQVGYTNPFHQSDRNLQQSGPVFMGSSQMIVPNNTNMMKTGDEYEEQSKVFPNYDGEEGQVMYEYVRENSAEP